jgi:hypothetical protein
MDTFDDIRPFTDAEVEAAMSRLMQQPEFDLALTMLFPEMDEQQWLPLLQSIKTVHDFQSKIIAAVVRKIAEDTSDGISISGLAHLETSKPYLFISNHRDIVLDSAFLNYLLLTSGFDTTRIAIGNNLLKRPWIEDLVKLNKNFIVQRNIPARQAYEYSLRLSQFIRHSMLHDLSSVWIAQREGRTKDGIDKTQSGLLKMLVMAWDDNPEAAFKQMPIVPVSISYEREPCAGLKARELYLKDKNGNYEKAPDEDLQSMQTGIMQQKGKVHFACGTPLNEAIIHACFADVTRNEGYRILAEKLDTFIQGNYRLSSFNYLAFDLLSDSNQYTSNYSDADKSAFERHFKEQCRFSDVEAEELRPWFLKLYAGPLLDQKQ